jgi:hypothetical protein
VLAAEVLLQRDFLIRTLAVVIGEQTHVPRTEASSTAKRQQPQLSNVSCDHQQLQVNCKTNNRRHRIQLQVDRARGAAVEHVQV